MKHETIIFAESALSVVFISAYGSLAKPIISLACNDINALVVS